MVKVIRAKGILVKADTLVNAPKKRWNLPCYDKSTCAVDYCSKYDTIKHEPIYAPSSKGMETRKIIYRSECDEDCKRRLNLAKVSVKVCVKANCEYLKVQEGDRLLHIPPAINCLKYIEESRGKRKPTRYRRERRIYRRGAVGGWHYRDV
jgi:hypothetical protein